MSLLNRFKKNIVGTPIIIAILIVLGAITILVECIVEILSYIVEFFNNIIDKCLN